jgi:hypothetical protein
MGILNNFEKLNELFIVIRNRIRDPENMTPDPRGKKRLDPGSGSATLVLIEKIHTSVQLQKTLALLVGSEMDVTTAKVLDSMWKVI